MHSKDWNDRQEPIDTSRVLIADDDEATRILLRTSLTQWGYSVIEAQDGEEAWEILKSPNPPHLLTLDWLMPKLDGIELCKRIEKDLSFHPYIIFLTRMDRTENMIQGLDAGADEFILKPFDLSELRIRIFAGERIIKYRHQLEAQKRQLQEYLSNIKQMSMDYVQKLLPFSDLMSLLQEIQKGLEKFNATHELPEIEIWQSKINKFIDILKNCSMPASNLPSLTEQKFVINSVPAEKIVQEGESIINMKRMQAFFGNDFKGIRDFIKTFTTLAAQQIKEIEVSIQNKDSKSAKYFFHLLGSASGNSGMMKIYEMCGIGEQAVLELNWEKAQECYRSLSNMLAKLEKEIEQIK